MSLFAHSPCVRLIQSGVRHSVADDNSVTVNSSEWLAALPVGEDGSRHGPLPSPHNR
jgi:hypothetical protein